MRADAVAKQDVALARLRELRVLLPDKGAGGGAAGDAAALRLHPDVRTHLRTAVYDLTPPPPPTLPTHLQARACVRAMWQHAVR